MHLQRQIHQKLGKYFGVNTEESRLQNEAARDLRLLSSYLERVCQDNV